jgi:cell division septation protein DedD
MPSPGESASPAGASGAQGSGLALPGEAAVPAALPRTPARAVAPGGQSVAGTAGIAGGVSGKPSASGASGAVGAARAPGAAGAAAVTGSTGVPGSAGATASAARPGAAGFGIQLGAFSSEAGANNEWRVLTARFGAELQGLHQHLVVVDAASGRIYRLQAAVGDEARARAICSSLRNRGQGCVAVLPN